MPEQKIMKDIGLNDPVSVTLPAHVWVGFIGAYKSTKWVSEDTSEIYRKVIDELFNPLFLKEQEAAMQENHDKHMGLFRHIFTGESPETPPHMEEGGGI